MGKIMYKTALIVRNIVYDILRILRPVHNLSYSVLVWYRYIKQDYVTPNWSDCVKH